MSVFTVDELAFLGDGRQAGGQGSLARMATVGKDGTPHVVPVGTWIHNTEDDTIEIRGRGLDKTKKFKDVARYGRAAIVIDDMVPLTPEEREAAGGWDSRPRAVEVRGRAETVTDPEPMIRIHPDRTVSWGTDPGDPGARRTSGSASAQDGGVADAFFAEYARALLARDAKAVAEMYAVPSLILFPGQSISVSDAGQTEAFFSSAWSQYEGITGTRTDINVVAESPHSVWADVTWHHDNGTTERLMYQLVDTGERWKIAVLTSLGP